jgi:WD40 repeat protein
MTQHKIFTTVGSNSLVASLVLISICTMQAVGVSSWAQSQDEIASSQTFRATNVDEEREVPVVSCLSLDPTGRILAAGGDDHLVRLWEIENGRIVATLAGHGDWVRGVAFTPTGDLVTAAQDGAVLLWRKRASDGTWRAQELEKGPQGTKVLKISPDGRQMTVAGFEKKIVVYELPSGRCKGEYAISESGMFDAAYSLDGRTLALVGRSGRILTFDTTTWRAGAVLSGSGRRGRAIVFLDQANRLAVAGDGGEIMIWNLTTQTNEQTSAARPAKIFSLALCGDDHVAAGGSDDKIVIWNWKSGEPQGTCVGHAGTVDALEYLSDQGQLASGSMDATLKIWPLSIPLQSTLP